jgi:sensor domain CHASE-containing protein
LGKQPPARDIRFPRGDFMMKLNRTLQSLFSHFAASLLLIFIAASIAAAQWRKQTIETKASLRGLSVVSEK